ncbi:hypothetical protein Q4577_22310 [Marinovum sp. 2_MG-2023]|uniref:hypothetical protein n=1 Tax=unclassified Marinovum TaxID=2647166 RepID=UPI0026E2E69F|nr:MULTISPECIES: hypothetical protein [unclassified Marinovum]MDO6732763.1 hypothetical protein [Marinovum sp. 2_MG-2023]MDO6782037.1 hypothetical protein [Marinovum sp. 1_MG-2023]
MTSSRSWIVLGLIMMALTSSCTAMAGDFEHWPATVPALAVMLVGKVLNSRFQLVKWPMEFIMLSAVTLILFNLIHLYFKPF